MALKTTIACQRIMTKSCLASESTREDVSDVALAPLATPFFIYVSINIKPYSHSDQCPTGWLSGLLFICTSDHLQSGLQTSGHAATSSLQTSGHLTSDHLYFWSFRLLTISTSGLWTSGHLNFGPLAFGLLAFGFLAFGLLAFGHLVFGLLALNFQTLYFWPSGHLPAGIKCLYLEIFSLPCRLHQSQIPNVLPGKNQEVFGKAKLATVERKKEWQWPWKKTSVCVLHGLRLGYYNTALYTTI